MHTSNGELRATRSELQEVAPLSWGEFTHGLKQILDTLAVHIKPMIRFDGIS